uniref:Uncharacterized protein n=1 Tax=Romanomermis culicivorax TaxID=13658 RepID=A0A915ING1_ROMCU
MSQFGWDEKISDVDEIPRLNFKRYRLGVGCIAKIRNSFYRCEILDFNLKRKLKAGIDDENIIESILDLFGVDTGEVYENIPGDKVFVVADEPTLTMTPHMVICCSLKGIKSTGYSPDDDVVMNKFENFIQRRKCRFMDYVDNNYQVEFLMAKGDSLGDHLVALRVALYREFISSVLKNPAIYVR